MFCTPRLYLTQIIFYILVDLDTAGWVGYCRLDWILQVGLDTAGWVGYCRLGWIL